MSDLLEYSWPHPMVVYVDVDFHLEWKQKMEDVHEKDGAGAARRIMIEPCPMVDDERKCRDLGGVKLVHNASLANAFGSQAFLWSDFQTLSLAARSGVPKMGHDAQTLFERYPNATFYHSSRRLARHHDQGGETSVSSLPSLQFACTTEACEWLYRRHQKASMGSPQPSSQTQGELHAQVCLEDPDACIVLRSDRGSQNSSLGNDAQTSLWQLLSDDRHSAAASFWNQLAVCTLVRNKNEYLPEWIEFHRMQGFDHFIIYDDASRSPSLFLESYIEDGIVTLIDWSDACARLSQPSEPHGFAHCQRAAFVDCQQRIHSRWLGVFDVDEFIFAPPHSNATVLTVLQEQPHNAAAGFHFVGAIFGNGNRTDPEFSRNKSDVVLVTERYTARQATRAEEEHQSAAAGLPALPRAHKEIARTKCVNSDEHGIHNFIYEGCPDGPVIEFSMSDPHGQLRMHHYQYLSVFQSHVKAQMNGNVHVAIADPTEHAAYNTIQDTTAASFGDSIRKALQERDARGGPAAVVIPRGVTFVLTSAGRFDLLNRTLESFRRYNTYPITRGIIVEDSGQPGIIDFVPSMFDFPVDIIYSPDLGEKRQHKVGMLGLVDCVDLAYSRVETEFIFHMEDDWEFLRPGFIEQSIGILDADPTLLQVWLRAHHDCNGHPILPEPLKTPHNQTYFLVSPEYGDWHGFSFNPGLRRLYDYKRLGTTFNEATKPHSYQIAGEFDINLLYYRMGYRAATTDVAEGFVTHLGWGRTTDPGCSHGC